MPFPKSHILLLGATGTLGRVLLPTLLSCSATLTVIVRSLDKLSSLFPSALLSRVKVVEGDAMSQSTIAATLRECGIEVIVDVAGNQVAPWREYVLERIVGAVVGAARDVGRERMNNGKGKEGVIRAWFVGGLGSLEYPGMGEGVLIQDFMPTWTTIQHQGTLKILEAVPIEELQWSLLCVAFMKPASTSREPLDDPRTHNLVLKAGEPPEWKDHWIRNVPLVGGLLNLFAVVPGYTTELEDVAVFLAEDAGSGSLEWVGKKVGMKQKEKRS